MQWITRLTLFQFHHQIFFFALTPVSVCVSIYLTELCPTTEMHRVHQLPSDALVLAGG